jgi:hypothetical protein
MSVFETLNKINVNDKTEQKNGLTYLSWAWAWGEAKKQYPEASYTIYENNEGWNYFTDGRTCWVKTGVTIEGLEHIEYLPVMDYRNKSITVDNVTSFDVNKAIQRSLTKALARHGLGLYIYAGEDLPDGGEEPKVDQKIIGLIVETASKYAEIKNGNADELLKYYLNKYKVDTIEDLTYKNGITISKELSNLIERSQKQ